MEIHFLTEGNKGNEGDEGNDGNDGNDGNGSNDGNDGDDGDESSDGNKGKIEKALGNKLFILIIDVARCRRSAGCQVSRFARNPICRARNVCVE
ncbi:MAG: hypothetical protein LBI02_02585 [Opitutaceae bacterium]|nr:hypothetical protein [Opitutaceae bacterium]